MMEIYTPGEVVFLESATGPIARVVVEDHGEVICVCREETWNAARACGHKPISVGFRKRDVIRRRRDCPGGDGGRS